MLINCKLFKENIDKLGILLYNQLEIERFLAYATTILVFIFPYE